MPKVSVLMPVYNAGEYLGEAIDSIIAQTFTDWELVIINDGSTDGSGDVARKYTDPRIRCLCNDKNRGLIYTRNRLIDEATGEYLAFLDSDDVSLPERLARQVNFLDKNIDYALCGTWGRMIDSDGRYLRKMNLSDRCEDIRCTLLFTNTFIQSSIMVRGDVLRQHPYAADFPLAEDYDLFSRLSEIYKLANLPSCLTLYRWHYTNISQAKKELMNSCVNRIYKREFAGLQIYPSDAELVIHSVISSKENPDGMGNKEYLKALRAWLVKLAEANKKYKVYNSSTFRATLCFRWIFACNERKERMSMLRLPVSLSAKSCAGLIRMLYFKTK
ncbi:glycosyltransferase involved in cell wall biosynthesis [Dysgonomonas sp. PH5-45]|uniref:glycosyltransferase family 2 protein n=1 Tax=unclassified Dysgonomonas TaxID=2630389 RepID=UPI002472EB7F|nr:MULTISPECIES: glycosyltransferase family 2 protein [unclassified Dysgonomonas]MDH6354844.1 glycosyltransferase involved in cell wall biosynthesis [Dysgonomonas sp. PH5-45]MDH6387743.1 glycosyltransferase involved in cell wall biosynthesis [Dysgonomonas sp. PH5-37]